MSRKPSTDVAQAAEGRFQGKIERNLGFRDQARQHNLGRNVRVIKVLTLLKLLRDAGKPVSGTVTCGKARRQNFGSNQGMTVLGLPVGPVQAAHFLPGTIEIGGIAVWDLVSDQKFSGQIEFLFGEVEHLPIEFNHADTASEASNASVGLCAALASACYLVLNEPNADPLCVAWQSWTQGARIALRTAISNKTEKGLPPPLVKDADGNFTPESIKARSTAGTSEWGRGEAVRILGYYLEDQEQRDWDWAVGAGVSAAAEIRAAFRP